MPRRLCACYKCVVSGRSWNLTVADFFLERSLQTAGGEVVQFEELIQQDDQFVALLFSSSHSYVCGSFCEQLSKVQDFLRSGGRRLQVIYISSDRSSQEMCEFMSQYPNWFSLQFSDQAIHELQSFLEVHTLPSLVILNSAGIISRSGRKDILRLGPRAWSKWTALSEAILV